VFDLVKNVSETMMSTLPNFWKIAKGFLEGKYKKNTPAITSRRSPSQVRMMALDIIKLYVSLLSEFFVFSDMAVMTPPTEGSSAQLLPDNSNSLTTAHYLMKILTEIQDNVNEINSMEISGDMSSSLRGLLESAKWGFEDVLTHAWVRDAHSFCYLETWALSSSEPFTTDYLSDIQFFQRQLATWTFKFASGAEASSSSSRLGRRPIPNEFVIKITKAFLDATYAFLDGLVHLAAEGSPVIDAENIPSVDISTTGKLQAMGLLDTSNVDTRTLLVISNFVNLKRVRIPDMITQLETAFNITVDNDKATLMSVVDQLDRTLFDDFIKPKVTVATGKLRGGILDPKMDWYETPQPTGERCSSAVCCNYFFLPAR
jgi:exocyst complex component 2